MLLECKNAFKVQRQFKRELQKEPSTRVTIIRIQDNFEADGAVQNVHKKRSQRRRTSTSPTRELETFQPSPRKSAAQAYCEVGISKSSVHRIMQHYH